MVWFFPRQRQEIDVIKVGEGVLGGYASMDTAKKLVERIFALLAESAELEL